MAQILLGALLAKRDFGVYAIAISVSSMTAFLRDGGAKQVLLQQPRDCDRLIGPVFWMSMAFNTGTGALIACLAPFVAWAYGQSELTPVLLVIAVCNPLSTPGGILAARLQVDMRFRELGIISSVSAAVRYLVVVPLAWLGLGPISFVAPLPLLAFIEWGMARAIVRDRPWARQAEPAVWWSLFKKGQWVLLGAVGTAGVNLGQSMIIGLFVPAAVVGTFYFAFQLVIQPAVIVSVSMSQVLVPAFSRIAGDRERGQTAAERILRQMAMISAATCFGMVATFSPLEFLIWRGKWADAAMVVHALATFYPATMIAYAALAIIQASGKFRQNGVGLCIMAGGTLLCAAAGAAMFPSAGAIAAFTGVGGALSAMLVTVIGLRQLGLAPRRLVSAVVPGWFVGIAAVVLSKATEYCVFGDIADPLTSLTGLSRRGALLRLSVCGTAFVVAFALLARIALPRHIRDLQSVIPARARRALGAVLRIR